MAQQQGIPPQTQQLLPIFPSSPPTHEVNPLGTASRVARQLYSEEVLQQDELAQLKNFFDQFEAALNVQLNEFLTRVNADNFKTQDVRQLSKNIGKDWDKQFKQYFPYCGLTSTDILAIVRGLNHWTHRGSRHQPFMLFLVYYRVLTGATCVSLTRPYSMGAARRVC